MRELSTLLGRKLAPHGAKFLHLAFLGSLGCLVAGWLLFDLIGPMGIILPSTFAIGIGLSEVDRQFYPVLRNGPRPVAWTQGSNKASATWTVETQGFVAPRRPIDFEESRP